MKSAAACLLFLTLPFALAADPAPGITVTGVGTVKAKPSVAELSFTIDANAEVAGDAITRFEQTRQRAIEALTQLQVPNSTIVHQAFSIGIGAENPQQAMQRQMMGGRGAKSPSQVMLAQPVTLRIAAIDKLTREQLIEQLTRVIDTARDLGLNLAGTERGRGMVRFTVENAAAVRTQALDAAFVDARQRAADLARRAEAKLGPITAVAILDAPEEKNSQPQMNYYTMWMQAMTGDEETDDTIDATSFSEIPVTVSVQLRYAIGN